MWPITFPVKLNTVDGVKVDFEGGWVHLRKSNTEPILRVYAEAQSTEEARRLIALLQRVIDHDRKDISRPCRTGGVLPSLQATGRWADTRFQTPYGEMPLVYADWTASGRLYGPIEERMHRELGPYVANTHTETSTTGKVMTLAYHEAGK